MAAHLQNNPYEDSEIPALSHHTIINVRMY